MDVRPDKLTDLEYAVRTYVKDGCHLSIGGFTLNRNPMAAVYEIIRQGVKKLHLYAHSNGQGMDELVGAGCVEKLEIAYAGNGRIAPTCLRFRKAAQNGTLLIEDYSNFQMSLRFLAGAMGVPFLPTISSLGSDLAERWGFPEEMRQGDSSLPEKKIMVIDNPFGSWGETHKVVLLPAITPDVTIIHVQKADRQGTARIQGLSFADVEQAKAARCLIVTCEEIVDSDELREAPDRNQIPFFCSDAVVHVPHGAYPTACYGYYDYDPVFLKAYGQSAKDEERYRCYLDQYIYGVKDHKGLLDLVGRERLEMIKADSKRGYAPNLDRR